MGSNKELGHPPGFADHSLEGQPNTANSLDSPLRAPNLPSNTVAMEVIHKFDPAIHVWAV